MNGKTDKWAKKRSPGSFPLFGSAKKWYDPCKSTSGEEKDVGRTAEERNGKIIGAVVRKAEETCPGALALIGVYGSFLTGDTHPSSDLDLMILINDDRGWYLASAFIQDDLQIGHDIYCTTWESLRHDAQYTHPHIAKLMDAKVVWCAEERYREQLESLRKDVREKLSAPLSLADYDNAEKALEEAEGALARAMMAESLSETRRWAGRALYRVEDAVALLNKTYFRLGVRRRYAELDCMERRPDALCALIENVACARTAKQIKDALLSLLRAVAASFESARKSLEKTEKTFSPESLAGTYEEIYSNWRGKMHLAASDQNRHLAFLSLVSADDMLSGIAEETGAGPYDALAVYDPDDLAKTAEGFDELLKSYREAYRRARLRVRRFPDVDAFLSDYLGKPF